MPAVAPTSSPPDDSAEDLLLTAKKSALAPADSGIPREWIYATEWWTSRLIPLKHASSVALASDIGFNGLSTNVSTVAKLAAEFRTRLLEEMCSKFEQHWFVDDPLKGSAFRSVSYISRVDPLLKKAADSVGIQNLEKLLAGSRNSVMFIDPGEVKIRQGRDSIVIVYKSEGTKEFVPLNPKIGLVEAAAQSDRVDNDLEFVREDYQDSTSGPLVLSGSSSCKDPSLGRSTQLGAILNF